MLMYRAHAKEPMMSAQTVIDATNSRAFEVNHKNIKYAKGALEVIFSPESPRHPFCPED